MKRQTKRCILWIIIGALWIIAIGTIAFIALILR